MSDHVVKLRVNGRPIEARVPANRLLLDFLRQDLGLTGAKEACSIGVCGACSVLVDGELLSACLLLTVFVDGSEVTTIEGLARGDQLDPLQKAFLERGAVQCGFCTPGQIIAARALLDEDPRPSEATIRHWLAGNLCRCTGYNRIVEAVQAAASEDR